MHTHRYDSENVSLIQFVIRAVICCVCRNELRKSVLDPALRLMLRSISDVKVNGR